MRIIKPSGRSPVWNSTHTREWVAGDDTPLDFADDVYSITGTANGTDANGRNYTANITTPVISKLTCKWFVSGKIEITPTNKSSRVVDFGSGTCDNQATVTIGTNIFNIELY